jgi:hypothetical protein
MKAKRLFYHKIDNLNYSLYPNEYLINEGLILTVPLKKAYSFLKNKYNVIP